MLKRSLYFLKHTKKFLNNWVQLGHDTCHRTHGYNAEKCHQDCKKKEKGSFAQQCRKDGGLFKCCIRFYLCRVSAGDDDLNISDETRSTATNVATAAPCQSAQLLLEQSTCTQTKLWRNFNTQAIIRMLQLLSLDSLQTSLCIKVMISDV